jgi:hypothetical protein
MIRDTLQHGGRLLKDGRYLPGKETVEACYNAYGSRIGLNDNWLTLYDNWLNDEKEIVDSLTS